MLGRPERKLRVEEVVRIQLPLDLAERVVIFRLVVVLRPDLGVVQVELALRREPLYFLFTSFQHSEKHSLAAQISAGPPFTALGLSTVSCNHARTYDTANGRFGQVPR